MKKTVSILMICLVVFSTFAMFSLAKAASALYAEEWNGNVGTTIESLEVGDTDNDGLNELVIYGNDGTVRVYSFDGSGYVQDWVTDIGLITRGNAVGDTDGDGKNEIVAGENGGKICFFEYSSPSYSEDFSMTSPSYYLVHDVSIGDTDGDGKNEVLMSAYWRTYVFSYSGSTYVQDWEYPASPGFAINTWSTVGDTDGDGIDEIILARNGANLKIFSFQSPGNYIIDYQTPDLFGLPWEVRTGDSDGDNRDEIVVGDDKGIVRLYDYDPTISDYQLSFQVDVGIDARGIAIGDVDGDGIGELITGENTGQLHVYSKSGASYALDWSTSYSNPNSIQAITVGDVDNDGINEILVGNGPILRILSCTAFQHLGVPLIEQETDRSCWAAASEMVLKYYGIYGPEISQIQIARELGHEEYYTNGIPYWQTGSWEWALENLGKLDASFSDSISFSDIVHDIDSAKPVIALYETGPNSGHSVVIVGYIDKPGTSDDEVIVNNPSPPAEHTNMKWSELQNDMQKAIRTQTKVEKSSISIHFTELAFGGFRRYSASSSTWWFWWFELRKWNGGWASIADAPDHYQQGSWSASVNIAINGQGNYRLHLSTSPFAPTTWNVNIEFVARALGFRAESPLNLLVTDPSGSSTGYDSVSEQMMTEIPRATYSGPCSEPQLIVIPDPLDGEYMVLLTGINSGTYTLTTDLVLPEGTTTKTHTGEIVEDAVYVYSVSITDEEMTATPNPEAELEHLKEFIDGLPDNSFNKPELANQRKNALFNKIDEVILKVEAGNYTDAINKLFHDIRAKMDGDPTPKDWIIDPEMQFKLCVIIDHIISSIETLQPQSD